jgi:hypothetical protein
VARHRSPRGRRAHQNPPLVALGRTVVDEVVRRTAPIPTPLRRGAAAVAVTGGALSLAAVASSIPLGVGPLPVEPVPSQVDPSVVAAAAVLPITAPATGSDADAVDGDRPTALVPVATPTRTVDAEVLDTAKLVKAVQLAEREAGKDGSDPTEPADAQADDDESKTDPSEKADPDEEKKADEPKSKAGASDCDLDTSQLGAVKPHVRSAANFLGCTFGEPTVLGVAGRAGTSDHPSGKALDFMVDRATGNALAACALRDQKALGVSYVIWRQRINFGSGWKPMEDRGGVTANHFDHVHVSFDSSAGGRPAAC